MCIRDRNNIKYRYDEDATQQLKVSKNLIVTGRKNSPYYYKDDTRTVVIYADPEKPDKEVVVVAGQEKNIAAWMSNLRTRMIIGIIAFVIRI